MPVATEKAKITPELQELMSQSTQMLAPMVLMSCWHVYSNKEWNNQSLLGYLANQIINPFFLTQIFSQRLDLFKKALFPFIPHWLRNDPNYGRLSRIKALFNEIKPRLSKENINHFAAAIHTREVDYKRAVLGSAYQAPVIEHQLEIIEFALNLFAPYAVASNFSDKQALNAVLRKIDKLLHNFTPAVQSRLRKEVIQRLLLNLHRQTRLPLTAFCLKGNSGVGKTWFVNALAAVTEIPILSLNAAEIRLHSEPSCLVNRTESKFTLENLHPLTQLQLKMREQNKSCGILFIDELDKTLAKEVGSYAGNLERFILDMVNENATTYEDRYLGLRLPLSNIILICACNQLPIEIHARFTAIQDRLGPILIFSDLNSDQKLNIVLQKAAALFEEVSLEQNLAIIEKLRHLVRQDKSPGVRNILRNLTYFVINNLCEGLFAGTIWDEHALESASIKIQYAWRKHKKQQKSAFLAASNVAAAPVLPSWERIQSHNKTPLENAVPAPVSIGEGLKLILS